MELFIEIFCEEIPSRMQAQAQKDFSELWAKELTAKGFNYQSLDTFIGPRRISVVAGNLEEFSKSITEERRGPKVGAPDAAVLGFLKSTGLTKEELMQQNGYWIANINNPGQSIASSLPEMLEQVLRNMPWPTSMRWPGAEHTWVRPIRNICCIYDGKVLEFFVKAAGLTTNNLTYGHRFFNPKSIIVTSFEQYVTDLESANVIVDADKRKNMIVEQLNYICNSSNLSFLKDDKLLDEVTGLVEYPYVGMGGIEQKFMALPNVVLSTSMRVHQKYFSILNSDNSYAPHFAFVANVPINQEYMVKGYEKVLRARLSDALFFFEQDQKTKLMEYTERLKGMAFHEQLGSVYDKIKRLEFCAKNTSTKEAALLCKSDLLTLMVGEFPELQGLMGEIYAKSQGVAEPIAKALSSYYKPLGADDDCPSDETGWQLSLIDKIDNLVGFLGVGIRPTGSKDPYGMRRSALGIIRLMLSKNAPCDLKPLIAKSIQSFEDQKIDLKINPTDIVIQFITERLANFLKNDMPADHIYAVLDQPLSDIWLTVQKARALQKLLQTSAGKALQAAYVRVNGILKEPTQGDIDQSLLSDNAELELYKTISANTPKIQKSMESFDFIQSMEYLAELKPAIDKFFDTVKVMDDNPNIQANRMCLLRFLQKTIYSFANFSKLEG